MNPTEQEFRDRLTQLARSAGGVPQADLPAIMRRAGRLRRRRALTAVAVAACAALLVGTTVELVRPQPRPRPGPISSGTPTPTASTSPTASSSPPVRTADARFAWVVSSDPAGSPPQSVLFVDTGSGARAVRTLSNAVVLPGGFLDRGRTVLWAEGNGDAGPYALALTPDGRPAGAPRPLLNGAMVGEGGILAIPGGGIALRVLGSAAGADRLVRMGDRERVLSDVAVSGGPFVLLAADAGGVVAGFDASSGGTLVRHVAWNGSAGPVLATLGVICPAVPNLVTLASNSRFWQLAGINSADTRVAIAVPGCDSQAVGGTAGSLALVAALDGTGTPTQLTGWTGLPSSLWWDRSGALHLHTFALVDSQGKQSAPRSYQWDGTGHAVIPDGLDRVLLRLPNAIGVQELQVDLASTAAATPTNQLVRATLTPPNGYTRAVVTGLATSFIAH
jgi:hypothetical protein